MLSAGILFVLMFVSGGFSSMSVTDFLILAGTAAVLYVKPKITALTVATSAALALVAGFVL